MTNTAPASGLYIWVLSDILAKRPDYLAALVRANCRRVYLKVLDDASPGIFWNWQCNTATIKRFTDVGIEVVGWGYLFDRRYTTDVPAVKEAVRKSIEAGCVGFVADLEEECKQPGMAAKVREVLQAIRPVVPPGQLGYTSFGNPEDHPEIPWATLQDCCDYQMPQMYYQLWGFGSNNDEVHTAMAQHRRMGLDKKPIYPIWTSEFNSKGTASTATELQSFIDRYPGSAIYAAQVGNSWAVNYRGSIPPAPTSKATWLDFQASATPGATITALTGTGAVVAQLTTNSTAQLISYLQTHVEARTFTLAPLNKPVPTTPT